MEGAPIPVMADRGFDSKSLIRSLHHKDRADFVIKHNLRKKAKES